MIEERIMSLWGTSAAHTDISWLRSSGGVVGLAGLLILATGGLCFAVVDKWFGPPGGERPKDLQQVLMQGSGATPKDPKYKKIPAQRVIIKGLARGSIVRLKDGTLLASGIGKGAEKKECVALFRSTDDGATWSTPEPISNFPSNRNHRNGYMTVLKDGTVLLLFKDRDRKPRKPEPLFSWSSDGGKTWTDPVQGPDNLVSAGIGGASFGGIVLPDGELLLPMFVCGKGEMGNASYVWRSRDGGRTFHRKDLIAADGYNETTLLRLPSGKLLAALREVNLAYPTDGDDFTAIASSTDDGRTWSPPRRVTAAWEHPGHLTLLPDGRVLLIYGVRHPPQGMGGLVSEDEGRTWRVDHPFLISWSGRSEYSGYPWGIVLKDGRTLSQIYVDSDPAGQEMVLWRVPKLP